ncbi:MAG: hypothetical protein K2X28_08385 [Alphaproteobacteria bacterium]|nr:hypothetical protein [Alphaproteobacteria bacterium]
MFFAKKIIKRLNFIVFSIAFLLSATIGNANVNNDSEKGKEAEQKEKKGKKDKKEEPPKVGNFTLPTSQQPGPLVSFGENIVDKNQTQLFLFADDYRGVKKHTIDIIPAILYGAADDLSIFFNVPVAASYKENKSRSSGLEDMFLQLEYAFYTNKTSELIDQATLVMNMTFPTGSTKKQPPTSFGSSSFFLGATFSRMYTDWFGFTSHGVVLTTSHDSTKFGNEFFYQAGFGRNILSIDSEWIFAWMIEADGQYTEKNKVKSITDSHSGGNTMYVTPSLWVSSKKIIAQLGFGLPATQHLFGNQKRNNYLLVANFGRTF